VSVGTARVNAAIRRLAKYQLQRGIEKRAARLQVWVWGVNANGSRRRLQTAAWRADVRSPDSWSFNRDRASTKLSRCRSTFEHITYTHARTDRHDAMSSTSINYTSVRTLLSAGARRDWNCRLRARWCAV